MVDQQIISYIVEQQQAGFSEQQIKQVLLQNGYDENQVNEAFQYLQAGATQQTNPQQSQQSQPSVQNPSSTTGIKSRNPIVVLLLILFTVGIYGLYWLYVTSKELAQNTQSAPNPVLVFLLLIPGVNVFVALYLYWTYSGAINELTGFNNIVLFILFLVFAPVGFILAQSELNKRADPSLSAKKEYMIFGVVGIVLMIVSVLVIVFVLTSELNSAISVPFDEAEEVVQENNIEEDTALDSTPDNNQDNTQEYNYEVYTGDGFSIEYPETWSEEEILGLTAFVAQDGTNMNVGIYPLTEYQKEQTLQEYVEDEKEYVSGWMTFVESDITTVSGYDAVKIVTEAEDSGETMTQVQYSIFKDEEYYVITFTTFTDLSEYQGVLDHIIDTFELN